MIRLRGAGSNPVLKNILDKGFVQDEQGKEYELGLSPIGRREGRLITDLIEGDGSIQKVLEVGCAYGISSLYIGEALSKRENPQHVIVDPKQNSKWGGIGILNLKRAGFDFFELIEAPSEFVLPKLAEKEECGFDMVFIDGMHTFDHTLIDLFYANRLIRVGGYIVVDDSNFPSVSKAVSYLLNYPAYRLWAQTKGMSLKGSVAEFATAIFPKAIGSYVIPKKIYEWFYRYPKMVALKKAAKDERASRWFKDF